MRVSETENGKMFILSNRDLKAIKKFASGISFNGAQNNEKVHYAFISEDHFERQYAMEVEKQKNILKQQESKESKEAMTKFADGISVSGVPEPITAKEPAETNEEENT